MARKKPDHSEAASEPEDSGVYSIKIDPDLVPLLKMVAQGLGMSAPNYANSRLRIIIAEEGEGVLKGISEKLAHILRGKRLE